MEHIKVDNHDIDVELDGKVIKTVSENGNMDGPQLLYESHYLEYGEHTAGYLAKGKGNEFFKIVFWPSLNAKRINITDTSFINKKGTWTTESDGIVAHSNKIILLVFMHSKLHK